VVLVRFEQVRATGANPDLNSSLSWMGPSVQEGLRVLGEVVGELSQCRSDHAEPIRPRWSGPLPARACW
jgi:hypothetical protein